MGRLRTRRRLQPVAGDQLRAGHRSISLNQNEMQNADTNDSAFRIVHFSSTRPPPAARPGPSRFARNEQSAMRARHVVRECVADKIANARTAWRPRRAVNVDGTSVNGDETSVQVDGSAVEVDGSSVKGGGGSVEVDGSRVWLDGKHAEVPLVATEAA